MIADDLFAGAGGWDLAAAQLGIHARGVENMKEARATRDAAGLTTIHDDVWTYEPDGAAEGLIASPPCQTFSAAGKGAGRAALDNVLRAIGDGAYRSRTRLRGFGMYVGDDRTALVLTPLHFAATADYEWLAWEQVPTVLPVWQACAVELEALGWHTWTGMLHAEQYGVPQTRKRAFLLASRRGPVAPPEPTHSRYYARDPGKLDLGVDKWVSMAEALSWAPQERPGEWWGPGGVDPRLPATTVAGDPRITARCHHEPGTQGRNPVASEDVRAAYEAGPQWCYNRPATTIVGSFKPEIVAGPGYRTTVSRQNADSSVRITIEEAGTLQSFPVDYPWQGAKGKQFLQVGNAVPPGMALHALSTASASRIEAVA